MKKKLKPVKNYIEPEYPELDNSKKMEEVDCTNNDVCSWKYVYCPEGGWPTTSYQYIGCSCEDAQCECGNNGMALPWW